MFELISELKRCNIAMWLDDGDIGLAYEEQNPSEELIDTLRQRKPEILDFLSQNSIVSESDFEGFCCTHNGKAQSSDSINGGEQESSADYIQAIYPASSLQQGFVYHHLSQPDDDAYRLQTILDYDLQLDIDAYKQAWIIASLRYPALRTAFDWQQDILQIVTRSASISAANFTINDLSYLCKSERDEKIIEIQKQDRLLPFDFSRPGLIRFTLIKQSATCWSVLVSLHHIISDGWSGQVIIEYVHQLYNQLVKGETPKWQEEHAYFEVQSYLSEVKDRVNAFWQKQKALLGKANDLRGLFRHAVDLNNYRTLEEINEYRLDISGADYSQLKSLCKKQGLTLNVALQFAWHKLLHVYTQDEKTTVGTTVSGRELPIEGLEQSVGLYINTLPLCLDWKSDASVYEMMLDIQQQVRLINSHSSVSLASLQEQGQRLFHSLLVFENYPTTMGTATNLRNAESVEEGIEHHVSVRKSINKADYPLTIVAFDRGEYLELTLKYDRVLLDAEGASRILAQVELLLTQLSTCLHNSHQTLKVLNDTERCMLIDKWNSHTSNASLDLSLQQLFETQASRSPHALAIICDNEQLSYEQLNQRANVLAHRIRREYLEKHGQPLGPDTFVGLYFDRSIEMLIAIIAVLKSGGAYVPISPDYPQQRFNFIVEDSLACSQTPTTHSVSNVSPVILTQEKHYAKLADWLEGKEPILIEVQSNNPFTESELDSSSAENHNPSVVSSPKDLAYLIYTSGTTGQPKGVMVEQRSVSNHLFGIDTRLGEVFKRVDFSTNYCFDLSVTTYLFPLLRGGSVCIYTDDVLNIDIYNLHLQSQRIDFVKTTPSIAALINTGEHKLDCVLVGGERLTTDCINSISSSTKRLFNEYGPTEAAIGSTATLVVNPEQTHIGKAFDNVRLYILSDQGEPMPVGVPGELYIGGVGVARGYLNRPELNADRFIPNPFVGKGEKDNRLYKTGDIVRWLPDGNVEFIRRNDDQIKLRGYRIELAEIENAILSHPQVKQVVVLPHEQSGSTILCAYIVTIEGARVVSDDIIESLSGQLPHYMVPNHFKILSGLPLTANGKIDRKALSVQIPEDSPSADTYQAPRNLLESQLCEIWQQVLSHDRIGIRDNFFRLGGDSIISIQLVSRLRQAGFSLQVKTIFDAPTVAELATVINENTDHRVEVKAEQGILEGEFDLLPIQQWFFDQNFANAGHWNQAFMLRIPAYIPSSEIENALHVLANHHDVLRCVFVAKGKGKFSQVYKSDDQFRMAHLAELNIQSGDEAIHKGDVESQLQRRLTDWQSDFDLMDGPLWRAAHLSGYEEGCSRLFFACHHLLIDTLSWRIIAEDLQKILMGKALGKKTSSYRQWTKAVQDFSKRKDVQQQLAYWQQLQSVNTLSEFCYPQSESSPEKAPYSRTVSLTEKQSSALLRLADKSYYAEVNDVLLSALAMALDKCFHHRIPLISLEGHGREAIADEIDISHTIGWFTCQYPIQLAVAETISDTIISTKEMLRRIPDKGLAYGAFIQNGQLAPLEVPVKFNYLGQFDNSAGSHNKKNTEWAFIREECGQTRASNNIQNERLSINGWVLDGVLNFHIGAATTTSENGYTSLEQEVCEYFSDCFTQALIDVSEQVEEMSHQGGLHSPSDYPVEGLTFSRLKALQSQFTIEQLYPANSLQQGFIFHHLNQPNDDAYRVQSLFDYHCAFDIKIWKQAWRQACLRFPALRTAFDWQGTLIQIITQEQALDDEKFTLRDLCELNSQQQEVAISEIQQTDRRKPFDLSQPGLIRFTIMPRAEKLTTVLISHHHSISDGWSGPILFDYVHRIYDRLTQSEQNSNTRVSTHNNRDEQDKAYFAAQRYLLKQAKPANDFWQQQKKQFGQANDISFMLSRSVDLSRYRQVENSASLVHIVPEENYQALRKLCQRQGVTLNVVLQYAWHKLIQCYTGDEQTIVGTAVSGRDIPVQGIESSVGLYINTLPLALNWEADVSVDAQLAQLQHQIARINTYSAVPLASIQHQGQRLFHSLFLFENYPTAESHSPDAGIQSCVTLRDSIEKVDYPLLLIASESPDLGLSIKLNYDQSLLAEIDAQRLLHQLQCILIHIWDAPTQSHQNISLLDEKEKARLDELHGPISSFPSHACLHELFIDQVALTPEAVAVEYNDSRLSYRELDVRVNELVGEIMLAYGETLTVEATPENTMQVSTLPADTLIALFYERSIDMLVAILAVLKAGGAYVPISPEFPPARIQFILQDTQSPVLLTQDHHEEHLQAVTAELESAPSLLVTDKKAGVIRTDGNQPRWEFNSVTSSMNNPDRLAYVIYTSGTSGKPKGVMLSHRAVVNRIHWMQQQYPLDASDCVLQKTPYSFDVSVWELFWAHWVGAKLVIAPPDAHKDPEALQHIIEQRGVTTLHFVPSMLGAYCQYLHQSQRQLPDVVKRVFCSGEALKLHHVEAFNSCKQNNAALINLYGPTEAAIDVTYFDTTNLNADCHSVPIGQAIQNIQLYVLDENQQQVPFGVPGELYLGGVGLARGYLNRPDLTASSFIDNPFATDTDLVKGSSRLYRTGDKVLWNDEGCLEYLGRKDFQVKIRGYRIELEEIEQALLQQVEVKQAVVIDYVHNKDDSQTVSLAAYLVLNQVEVEETEYEAKKSDESHNAVVINTITQRLNEQLPEYMLPSSFTVLDALPTTINGKLDRAALPAPHIQNSSEKVVARTPLEQQLCEIWQEVLGVDQVGIEDNFFRIGGDSIVSIQLVSKLRESGFTLQVKAIFEAPTVSQLAALIERQNNDEIEAEQGDLCGEFDLLPVQHWFFEQNVEKPNHWNQAFMLRLDGNVSSDRLSEVLRQLSTQHDMLRVRFIRVDGSDSGRVRQSYQNTDSFKPAPLQFLDVRECSQAQRIEKFDQWQSELDIYDGPLWQCVHLTGYEDGSDRLMFASHHLIMDAVSWRIISRDIDRLLKNHTFSSKTTSAQKTSSYRQWVAAVQKFVQDPQEKEESNETSLSLQYWQNVMSAANAQAQRLPSALDSRTQQALCLSESLTTRLLRDANQGLHTEVNDLLLSALAIALSETFGNTASCVTLEGHGRECIDEKLDLSHTVGWFTTLYPVCLNARDTVVDTIVDTKEQLRALPNKGLAYGAYCQADKLHGGLPALRFNYLGQFDSTNDNSDTSGVHIVHESCGRTRAQENRDNLLLDVTGVVINGQMQFEWQSLLSAEQSQAFTDAFNRSLHAVVAESERIAAQGGRKTPSDFAIENLNATQLSRLQARFNIEHLYPATSLQQGFIYHHLRHPQDDAYRLQSLLDYPSDLDIECYQQAWKLASLRYPSLRTAFDWQAQLIQVVTAGASIDADNFSFKDISHLSVDQRKAALKDIQQQERRQPFALDKPGLIRFTLIQQTPQCMSVLICVHHIISDGWSGEALMDQVHAYYDQLKQKQPVDVKPERAYLAAQEYFLSQRVKTEHFWAQQKQRFGSANDISPMLNQASGSVDEQSQYVVEPAEQQITLEGENYHQLKSLSQAQGVTLNVLIQYAWHKLVQAYTDDDQTIVGTTVSGRDIPVANVEQSVGLYINTLPLALDWSTHTPVSDQLQNIQQQIASLNSYSSVPLASLQNGGQRLFNTLFIFENYPERSHAASSDGLSKNVHFRHYINKVDYPLSVLAYERGQQLVIKLKFDRCLLDEAGASRLLAQMNRILQQLCSDPEQPHHQLSLLSDGERDLLVNTWNQTTTDFPLNASVQQLFEEQVSKTPDALAVYCDDQQLSYAELNQRANLLAAELCQRYQQCYGHSPSADTLIGLYFDRSVEMLVAILAVLKVGGAYVPISPEYPKQRSVFIIEDSLLHGHSSDTTGQPFILTQNQYCPRLDQWLSDYEPELIDCDASSLTSPSQDLVANPKPVSGAGNLAYAIYTSGTSGQPKCVLLEQRSVINHMFGLEARIGSVFKRVDFSTNYCFDLSVTTYLFPLLRGGCVCVYSDSLVNIDAYNRHLKNFRVNFVKTTPSLATLINTGEHQLDCVLVGGERLTRACIESVSRYTAQLFNEYGPTEAAIGSTATYVASQQQTHIGKAFANVLLYVLDTQGEPVPIGVPGELYIGGTGVARGYLNRPELNRSRFIVNPFNSNKRSKDNRLYKTGDIVRWLPDGNLEFLRRNDGQIKLRGYRIELAEIEKALLAQPEVHQASVLCSGDVRTADSHDHKNPQLHAYIVCEQDAPFKRDEIRARVANELPAYMVPNQIVQLASMPLTPNGKVDTRALRQIPIEPQDEEGYEAPRNIFEQQLCDIWQDLLGCKRVGITDNFFMLGGDSILSIQLVSKLREVGYILQVKDVFEAGTVAKLACILSERELRETQEQACEIETEQGCLEGGFPLLPIQQWFFEQAFAVPEHWNHAFMLRIPGYVNRVEINDALDLLSQQHDMLRCTFSFAEDGRCIQQYQSTSSGAPLAHLDVSALSDQDLASTIEQWHHGFDLSDRPLWQAVHLQGYQDNSARLLFISHHLIMDAVSWRILADDIQKLLGGQALPEKTSSYRQWVGVIEAYAKHGANEEIRYWEKVSSSGVNPVKDTSTVDTDATENILNISLDEATSQSLLRRASGAYNTEVNDLLLSALAIALDAVWGAIPLVCLEGHGRESVDQHIDLSRTVGWFTCHYPVQLTCRDQIGDTIVHTKETLRQVPNKGIGYGAFTQHGKLKHAEMPVKFNYLGQFGRKSENNLSDSDGSQTTPAMWDFVREEVGTTRAKENRESALVSITGGAVNGCLQFQLVSCLPAELGESLLNHFKQALFHISQHCVELAEQGGVSTPSDYPIQGLRIDHLQSLQQRYKIESLYSANSLQQGFVYHHLSQPNDDAYRVQLLIDYHQSLDLPRWKQAWNLAAKRYPALRTAFDWEYELIQIIAEDSSISDDHFQFEDLSDLSTDQQAVAIARITRQDREKPFELSQPGLIRFVLMKQHDELITVLITHHHSITDGWSGPLLFNTVHQYYTALMQGHEPRIEVDESYHAAQLYRIKQERACEQYWLHKKREWPVANDVNALLSRSIDADLARVNAEPAACKFNLQGKEYSDLKAVCQQQGITLNVALQFAWHKLLHHYTRDEQTLVGTTVSGRDIPVTGIQSSVGLYINTLPLCMNWPEEASIAEQLQQLQQHIAELNTHSTMSLASLQSNGQRLFHSLFVFENYPKPISNRTGVEEENEADRIEFRQAVEKTDYPLCVIAYEQGDELVLKLSYDQRWLEKTQAQRLLTQLQNILNAVVDHPEQPHRQISLLSADERQQIVENWNATRVSYPTETLVSGFENQLASLGKAPAVIDPWGTCSYEDLQQQRLAIAQHLLDLQVDQGELIAILCEKSRLQVAAVLAVPSVQCAFLPLNIAWPEARLLDVLDAGGVSKILLSQSQHDRLLNSESFLHYQCIVLDEVVENPVPTDCVESLIPPAPDDIAYVIFTSGSTGRPKGVVISHEGACNTLTAVNREFKVGSEDSVLALSDLSFDLAIYDLFGLLAAGGTVVFPEQAELNSPAHWLDLIQQYDISLWNTVPQLAQLMVEEAQQACSSGDLNLPSLRLVMMSGDWIPLSLPDQLSALNENICVMSLGGATEGSIWSIWYPIVKVNPSWPSIPYGLAMPNQQMWVLDDGGQHCPYGCQGEIHIGGVGVAKGYFNDPEKTAAQFIEHPELGTLYKTGDMGCWHAQGYIEFQGRKDFQVKINGYRIELGDIESALLAIAGVKQAVVIDHEHQGSRYLVAYVISESGFIFDSGSVGQTLSEHLPAYMVPAAFIELDALPLTVNGKLNRAALPEPQFNVSDEFEAPTTLLEEQLCELWQSLLKVERVGIRDNFFRLGGDSIISIQLVSRLRKLGFSLQVQLIFEAPTVALLAERLQHPALDSGIQAEQGRLQGDFVLLPNQAWFFEQNLPKPSHWNQAFMIRITGEHTTSQVAEAMASLASHHDMLRTQFEAQSDGSFRQCYQHACNESPLASIDVSTISVEQLTTQLSLLQSDFDLVHGPLWRAAHIQGYQDGSARVFFAAHHLIIDAVSWRIIADDLSLLLQGEALPPKTSSYRQWVQTVTRYGEELKEDEVAYWQDLVDAQKKRATQLPRPGESQHSAFSLDQKRSAALVREANYAYHTDVSDLLLSALSIALAESLAHAENLITLEGHGRESIDETLDLSHTLGWFTSFYPVKLQHEASIRSTIVNTKEMLRAIPKKGIGFGAGVLAKRFAGTLPELRFNYLGQFDEHKESHAPDSKSAEGIGQLVKEDCGATTAQENTGQLLLNINCGLLNGELQVDIASTLPQAQSQALTESFRGALLAVVDTCLSQISIGSLHTPSDYGIPHIPMDHLEYLQQQYAIEAICPANSLQQGFVFHHLSQPDDDAYRVQAMFDYSCELDIEAWREAWQLASLRYPVLRMAFDWQHSVIQIITEGPSFGEQHFSVIDLQNLSAEEQDAAIREYQQQDRERAFDLSQPGLMRFTLMRRRQDLTTALISYHHSISDGWSGPLLFNQVHEYYNELVLGQTPSIDVDSAYLAVQDYYRKRQHEVDQFWQQAKQNFGYVNDINPLLSKPSGQSQIVACPASQNLNVFGDGYQALKLSCQNLGVTLNVAVQFAWHKLLQCYTQDEQTLVGTTVSGRDIPIEGVDESVGLYINTLPLALAWPDQATIAEQLQRVQQKIAELNSFSSVSLASLQDQGQRLFHSLFVFENHPTPVADLDVEAGEERGIESHIQFREGVEKVDYPLSVVAYEHAGLGVKGQGLEESGLDGPGLVVKLCYDQDQLNDADAQRLLSQMHTILNCVADTPELPHSELSLLDTPERATLAGFHGPDSAFPNEACLYDFFAAQVARSPNAIALEFNDSQLSYFQLEARVNQLAERIVFSYTGELSANGALPEDTLIALYFERSVDMLVAALAVLKVGGAYVPISPEFPAARIQFILQDTASPFLLTQTLHQNHLQNIVNELDKAPAFIFTDTVSDTVSKRSVSLPPGQWVNNPDRLAYVIYTSGTSGKPKGVMVSHRAVVNRIHWMQQQYPLDASDCVLQKTPYSFDVSVWELFWAHWVGAKLVIAAPGIHKDPEALQALMHQRGVTTLHFVPSMLGAYCQFLKQSDRFLPATVKRVFCSGEALKLDQVSAFKNNQEHGSDLINLYGPTEAAIDVTYFDTKQLSPQDNTVPIGQAIQNIQLYVLDEHRQQVPIGVPGELFLGGVGLARGYLNRPELTASSFIENPFATEADRIKGYTRLYKTGDRVRWRKTGQLEYLGRKDFQVKIRGYRIELGEIEQALLQQVEINQAVVVDIIQRNEESSVQSLAAYIVLDADQCSELDNEPVNYIGELMKQRLTRLLPEYMIPSSFTIIEALPITLNGKLDRKALPAPNTLEVLQHVSPRNSLEQQLCDIWQEVLGVACIGIDDNFFGIGGDSIVCIQLVSKLRQQGFSVQVKHIFDAPTVAELAELIQEPGERHIEAEQGDLSGEFDLLPVQQWFFEQAFREPNYLNQAFMLKLEGHISSDMIQRALEELSIQHDMLRVRFVAPNGPTNPYWRQTYQRSDIFEAAPLKLLDTAELSENEIAEKLTQWQGQFDLTDGPLWQAVYLTGYKDGYHRLMFACHHLLLDAVSWRIIADDMNILLDNIMSGEQVHYEKTSSYRQWVTAVQSYVHDKDELNYWQNVAKHCEQQSQRLSSLIVPKKNYSLAFDKEITASLLRRANEGYHTDVNDLLLSALAIALAKTFGHDTHCVTLEGHGRETIDERLDLSRTVGWFTSLYPLCLHANSTVGDTIVETKELLRSLPNKGLGYGALRQVDSVGGVEGQQVQSALPPLRFNYLGQFDQHNTTLKSRTVSLIKETCGRTRAQANDNPLLIDINGGVLNGKMQFELNSGLSAEQSQVFIDAFDQAIKEVVAEGERMAELGGRKTPSDFAVSDLSMERLAHLYGHSDEPKESEDLDALEVSQNNILEI